MDVQVMNKLNPLGDMPTASVPQVEMNGAKNEKAIPNDTVEPSKPNKFGWRLIERTVRSNRESMCATDSTRATSPTQATSYTAIPAKGEFNEDLRCQSMRFSRFRVFPFYFVFGNQASFDLNSPLGALMLS